MKPQWFFRQHIRGEHISQSINSEFFKTDHIANIVNALVRETIQNSLDARSDDKKNVKVRFFLGKKSITHFDLSLFKNLSEHVGAEDSGIDESNRWATRRNFHYIACEDFGTKGLLGDVLYADSRMPKEENDFYFYFRNDGRSGKTQSDLGKWGIGKTIFPAISKINTFWALTIRERDTEEYLMGRCILGYHTTADGKGYTPWGYYGLRQDTKSFLIVPDSDLKRIENFKKLFSLKRDHQPGLSVIVPYVEDDFTFDSVAYSCISQFLFPILNGELEITVEESGRSLDINRNTIDTIVANNSEEGGGDYRKLLRVLDFAKYACEVPKSDYVLLRRENISNTPKWSERALFDDETLKFCRESFEKGERMAFIVPVQIHPKRSQKVWGTFKLYLERDPELDRSEDVFVREGLIVPGVRSISGRQLRGIFLADQSPLTDFLRDAENPAHTEWQENAHGFRDKYEDHAATLNFVKNCLSKLLAVITKPLDEVDVDLLADWFPFETSTSSMRRGTKQKRKRGKRGEKPQPPSKPSVPVASVSQITGGFRVSRNADYKNPIDAIEALVAYHTSVGNPLKRYHPLDFSFENGDLSINERGVRMIEIGHNRILWEILNKDFEIKVKGFDENRDIYVKVTKVIL